MWPSLATELTDFGQPDIRKLVGLFVSVMHLRGPDTLCAIEDIHHRFVSLHETAPRNPDGPPNVQIVAASGDIRALDTRGWEQHRTADANDHRRFFAQIIQSEAVRIAERLIQKRWCTLLAEDDVFVTSDRPVSVQHRSRVVFGTPGSMVTFPLTPRRLLNDGRQTPGAIEPVLPIEQSSHRYPEWTHLAQWTIVADRSSDSRRFG